MATFVIISPKATNKGNSKKLAKASKKTMTDDSLSRKRKKKSIHLMMTMFKGYLMS